MRIMRHTQDPLSSVKAYQAWQVSLRNLSAFALEASARHSVFLVFKELLSRFGERGSLKAESWKISALMCKQASLVILTPSHPAQEGKTSDSRCHSFCSKSVSCTTLLNPRGRNPGSVPHSLVLGDSAATLVHDWVWGPSSLTLAL